MDKKNELLKKINECEKMLELLRNSENRFYLCKMDDYLCSVKAISTIKLDLEKSFNTQAQNWYENELNNTRKELIKELEKDLT